MMDTEKIMHELEKFIEENGGELTEELKNEFIEMYNSQLDRNNFHLDDLTDEEKAQNIMYDIYEMSDDEGRYDALLQVLALDPDNIDALLMRLEYEDLDDEKELKHIIALGKEKLHNMGYDDEESIGHYWGIIETRPFMRAMRQYFDYLRVFGKYRLALQIGQEILRLNEHDNTGVRYGIMAVYTQLEMYDEAVKFNERWDEPSAFMLIPLILLCLKLDKVEEAKQYYDELQEYNPSCNDVFQEDGIDEDTLEKVVGNQMYQHASKEEIYLALYENIDVIMLNPDMNFEFFYDNLREKRKGKKRLQS